MKPLRKSTQIALVLLSLSLGLLAAAVNIGNLQPFRDPTGYVATYNTAGDIDENNDFFQPLGTNGRTCATCHQADQAFGLNARHVQQLFSQTHGDDPLFAPVDGANCPDAGKEDAAGHSLLLKNGLIRVGITLPANTEFNIPWSTIPMAAPSPSTPRRDGRLSPCTGVRCPPRILAS